MVEPATSGARPRRTQEERRTTTRTGLLEATIAALVDLGYRGTTTLEVERRAGVSRGARLHHFPHKAALLAGAADHLYTQISDHYAEAFGGGARAGQSDSERARLGLRELWAIYQRPHYTAVVELNLAARTDAELRAQLGQVALRHRALALAAARQFFPDLSELQARTLIETAHAAFLGMRLQGVIAPDPDCADFVLAGLEDLIRTHLEHARTPC